MFKLPEKKNMDGSCTACQIKQTNERLKAQEAKTQARFEEIGEQARELRALSAEKQQNIPADASTMPPKKWIFTDLYGEFTWVEIQPNNTWSQQHKFERSAKRPNPKPVPEVVWVERRARPRRAPQNVEKVDRTCPRKVQTEEQTQHLQSEYEKDVQDIPEKMEETPLGEVD